MKAWFTGLLFSLVVGGLVTWLFLKILRRSLCISPLFDDRKRVPPWLTGATERLFFTLLIGLGVEGITGPMIGWLALKLATNWNHPDWKDKPNARTFALSALLAGLISMLFAYIGGLLCASKISLP